MSRHGGAVRAWLAVHAWVTGAIGVVCGASLATALGGVVVRQIGDIIFARPTTLSLIGVVVVVTAMGLALSYEVSPAVVRGRVGRVRIAASLWLAAVLAATSALTGAAQWWGGRRDVAAAVLCNIGLLGGMVLILVGLGAARLAWVAPAALSVVALLLGQGSSGVFWWSAFLDVEVSAARVIISAAVLLVGAVCHVWFVGGALGPLRGGSSV